jgi:hypothetical protein
MDESSLQSRLLFDKALVEGDLDTIKGFARNHDLIVTRKHIKEAKKFEKLFGKESSNYKLVTDYFVTEYKKNHSFLFNLFL